MWRTLRRALAAPPVAAFAAGVTITACAAAERAASKASDHPPTHVEESPSNNRRLEAALAALPSLEAAQRSGAAHIRRRAPRRGSLVERRTSIDARRVAAP